MEEKQIDEAPLAQQDWLDWAAYVNGTFGVTVTEGALASFKELLAGLKEWNAKMNLVSFKSDKEVLYRHFADSLAGYKLIKELSAGTAPRIADIGTGAGFPGLPFYIATGFTDITLVESITKKTLFQAEMKQRLGMTGLKIINDRVENVARDSAHRAGYDFVLSRAVTKLSPNIEIAVPLLKTGGYALLYKTEQSMSEEELSGARNAMGQLGCEIARKFCYTIPGESRGYCVAALKKVSPTSGVYPRKAGMPEKKPL
jgi:16S rRNA (guanine527-N7)-methyltransferase